MFQPLLSWSTVSVCTPAGKVTLVVTVVQSWYPPVFGTAIEPVRLVPAALTMCSPSVSPYGEARRRLTE